MFNKVKRMFREEEATGIIPGCIDGFITGGVIGLIETVFLTLSCCCGCFGLPILWHTICGSIGGCTGGIINAIFNLCW